MLTEFEAKMLDVDIQQTRATLHRVGAVCVQEMTLMKRVVFDHPHGEKKYFRVRDEGKQVTITAKDASGTGLDMVKELETTVGSFATMVEILAWLGFTSKSYQETKREEWQLGTIQIMIDERPGLPPFAEIEGPNEQAVRAGVILLGGDRNEVVFGTVDEVYHRVYGVSHEIINTKSSYRFDEPVVF